MAQKWNDLPKELRREVEVLAKSGRRHSSHEVARAAYEWATELTRNSPRAITVGVVLEAVIDGLTGTYGAGQSIAERRLARRVVGLGGPTANHVT